VNKSFHVFKILKPKAEIVGFLSRKNCEYIYQIFGQEFNTCEKETILSIPLKVSFTFTLDVNFILMFKFNFILTCYFDIFKGEVR
jgi:hypothetical protein